MAAAGQFFAEVEKALTRGRPDWVHERLSLFAGEGTAMASRLGLPRVVEVNAPIVAERQAHFSLTRRDEAAAAERAALDGASVVSVSAPLAAWSEAMGAARTQVVPNGATLDPLGPRGRALARRLRRESFGFGDDVVVVGFTGSLKPWHGVELLVEAVGRIAAVARVGLLVVGDGPVREVVEGALARLPPAVHSVMTGAVPSRLVPEYLAAMDVAAAPYLPAGSFYFSPLKVAEAMASHLPVVASDFPPVRELLGDAGILVPPGDVASLADAIAGLANDRTGRVEHAAAGWSRALARLDWRVVAQRVVEAVPLRSAIGTW
jgi:glycosyltransferase involved in cell wall biosynthesis